MTDQQPWFTFLDASKNAANEFVTSSKNINEYRVKNKEQEDEESANGIKSEEKDASKEESRSNTVIKRIIQYVEKPVNYALSTITFSLLLLATFLLIWQLVAKIKSYVENPMQVTSTYTYPDQLAFPSIVLCNNKPWMRSYMADKEIMNLFRYVFEPSASNLSQTDLKSLTAKLNNINMTEFFIEAVKKKEDFILSCEWPNGTTCDMNAVSLVLTDLGICYRLDESATVNVSYPGLTNSLQLMLNIESYNSVQDRTKTVGARLIVHNKNETPSGIHMGFDASPGMLTTVTLSYRNIQRLPKERKGKCNPKAESKLFRNYSLTACKVERFFANIVKHCNCEPFNYPARINSSHENSLPKCNAEQEIFCVLSRRHEFIEHNLTSCSESCNSWEYPYDLLNSKISTDFIVQYLDKNRTDSIIANYKKVAGGPLQNYEYSSTEVSIDEAFVSNNIVMLTIYFKDISIITIAQSLTYSNIGLAGDIAGTIGIIIGFMGTTGLALYQSLKNISVVAKEELRKLLRPNHTIDVKCKKDAEGNVVMVVHEFEQPVNNSSNKGNTAV